MSLLLAPACDGERGLLDVDDNTGIGGGNTGGADPLVGEWEVTFVIFVSPDVQTWTTNWIFAADATCEFEQTVRSALDGTTIVDARTCTWSTTNGRLRIQYDDSEEVTESAYSFPGGDTTRLLFQDVEYQRVDG